MYCVKKKIMSYNVITMYLSKQKCGKTSGYAAPCCIVSRKILKYFVKEILKLFSVCNGLTLLVAAGCSGVVLIRHRKSIMFLYYDRAR